MLGCKGETPEVFRAALARALASSDGALTAPAAALIAGIPRKHSDEVLAQCLGKVPSNLEYLASTIPGSFGSSALSLASTIFDRRKQIWTFNSKVSAINCILAATTLSRATVAMPENERAIVTAMAETYAAGLITIAEWTTFLANVVWNNGSCDFQHDPEHLSHKHLYIAREVLSALIRQTQPSTAIVLEKAARTVALKGTSKILGLMTQGAHWITPDEITASRALRLSRTPASLLLGADDTGRDIYVDGNESLITFGPPGSGKSQALVITNLLTYPGSAFVLDVKDELWAATAAHRQATFGPVYRFAPTDPTRNSHAYNPFDHISTDPDTAALDCQVFGHQLVPEMKDLKDPYWEDRARDFLWSFAMLLALNAPKPRRTISTLAELFALPLALPDPTTKASTPASRLIKTLRRLSKESGIPDLATTANAIETGLATESTRLESIFDQARRHVATFARSSYLRQALSRSDWAPQDLRRRVGTTVYFCLKPGELRVFAPLVRLIFQQHISLLTREFTAKRGEPPITFFLDEMPQLGKLGSIHDLLDLGRGAGLRLWIFAQYIGQLRVIYGQQTDGLINACRVRTFLQPDNDAATFIAPTLGQTRHLFTGEKRPLAEPHDLLGPAFTHKLIALVRGEHPLSLAPVFAYDRFKGLQKRPPPRVR